MLLKSSLKIAERFVNLPAARNAFEQFGVDISKLIAKAKHVSVKFRGGANGEYPCPFLDFENNAVRHICQSNFF